MELKEKQFLPFVRWEVRIIAFLSGGHPRRDQQQWRNIFLVMRFWTCLGHLMVYVCLHAHMTELSLACALTKESLAMHSQWMSAYVFLGRL